MPQALDTRPLLRGLNAYQSPQPHGVGIDHGVLETERLSVDDCVNVQEQTCQGR